MHRRVLAALSALPLLTTLPTGDDATAATVPTPAFGRVRDVALQSDGKVLVAFDKFNGDRFTLVRLRPDLSPDPSFGGDGVVETIIEPGSFASVDDLAVQPDGRIVAAGSTRNASGSASAAVLLRYRADGSLDPTFGDGDGEVISDLSAGHVDDARVALTSGGRIVVGGSAFGRVVAARFLSDGSVDRSFGTAGSTIVDLPAGNEFSDAMAVDAAGNVLIGGLFFPVPATGQQHVLLRINSGGQLDPSFATGGVAMWSPGSGEGGVHALAVQPDGRIVAAGSTEFGGRETLARFLASGHPDQTFGIGGFVTTSVAPAFTLARPGVDLALLRDGRIALGGSIGDHARVSVFGPDGSPDPSFDGDDGVAELPLGLGNRDDGGYLAVTRSGAIVVAGVDVRTDFVEGTLEVVAVPGLAAAADLRPVVTVTPNPAPAGPVEYTVNVRNDGPQPATGVSVMFELSQGIDVVTPRSGTCHQTTTFVVTCSLGPIASGQEVTAMSVDTIATGSEEGLFGTTRVTSSSYDPDPTDNIVTTEVLIDGGTTR